VAPDTRIESAFRTVHRRLRPRTSVPSIEVRIVPSVGANHSAVLESGRLRVKVSDLFSDAPEDVLEALAVILLSRLYRKKVDPDHRRRYRQYTLSPEMRQRSRDVRRRRSRPRPARGPRGRAYDLECLFRKLNGEYFNHALPQPGLSWTERSSRRVLGSYEFDEDTIFLSRWLDSPRVPEYVVRYVLFHEMLHVRHGMRVEGIREIVHPPEFRRQERAFSHYREAQVWLEAQ
jgi:SprT-like family